MKIKKIQIMITSTDLTFQVYVSVKVVFDILAILDQWKRKKFWKPKDFTRVEIKDVFIGYEPQKIKWELKLKFC